MNTIWTRERIIRYILKRETEGCPLTTGGEGVEPLLSGAARRIFGSWRNAILAAGISPGHVLTCDRWSPAKILAKIRLISRLRRRSTSQQLDRRYDGLVSAARRHFGSWSRAARAAGVDPVRLRRVVPWNRERVIEAVLTRALRGESLRARSVEPRSLVDAAQRIFGTWHGAMSAAGLDLGAMHPAPARAGPLRKGTVRIRPAAPAREPKGPWNKQRVIEGICARVREHLPINAWAVSREYPGLYDAGRRYLGSWDHAIRAAGFDPAEHRRDRSWARRAGISAPRKSQRDDTVRPDRRE